MIADQRLDHGTLNALIDEYHQRAEGCLGDAGAEEDGSSAR